MCCGAGRRPQVRAAAQLRHFPQVYARGAVWLPTIAAFLSFVMITHNLLGWTGFRSRVSKCGDPSALPTKGIRQGE
jgi:hypothetical protein